VHQTVLTALADALEREPGRPLVTFYDGASGERIELSVVTFTNWVNKIANLFADELMLDSGEIVHVELPAHWQSGVVMMGAWTAGLSVGLGAPTHDVAASVVGPAARAHAEQPRGQVLACSLRPMGGAFVEKLPDGWLDFAREVPPQPDALMSVAPIRPDDPALVVQTHSSTHADLVAQASETADELELSAGGRLITDANPARPSGLAAALVGPVLVGASVVLTANCDAEQRAKIGEQERVTAQFWLNG
jgi:uncharacterized protein (TIGR03089 family)